MEEGGGEEGGRWKKGVRWEGEGNNVEEGGEKREGRGRVIETGGWGWKGEER